MENVQQYIGNYIKRYKRGDIIAPTDFRGKANDSAIRKALSRLTIDGTLVRLGQGLYILPKRDSLFGTLLPSTEEIAFAIAEKEKVKIRPSGASALHKLGLTLQVPTKLVYYTDGSPRNIKVGNNLIRFKKSTPRKMALKGELSGLIILALEDLDTDQLDEGTTSKLKNLLKKENPAHLKNDLKLASVSVYNFLLSILKDDSMA